MGVGRSGGLFPRAVTVLGVLQGEENLVKTALTGSDFATPAGAMEWAKRWDRGWDAGVASGRESAAGNTMMSRFVM